MRLFVVIAITVVIAIGCSRDVAQRAAISGDAIDRLMTQVPFEDCPSYLYVPVDVSTNAEPEVVIAALAARGTFREERIARFTIEGTRRVHSRQERAESVYYTAVSLDTNLGRKIVLLQPEAGGWYYKIYDAK